MDINNPTQVPNTDLPDEIPLDLQTAHRLQQQQFKQENENYNLQQEKYGTLGQQALAGAEALGRGVSLGTSDLINPANSEDIQGRREANPVTSFIGEGIGGGALIGATGGAGAIGLTGIPALAAEGATFGAGQAVSDYALGDPNLNAQKILSYVGTGAALGTGLGILGKSVEAILPASTRKLVDGIKKLKDYTIGSPESPGIFANIAPEWSQKLYDGMIASGKSPQQLSKDISSNISSMVKASKDAVIDLYEKAGKTNITEALENTSLEDAQNAAKVSVDNIHKLLESKAAEMPVTDEDFYSLTGKNTKPFSSNQNNKLIQNSIAKWENDIETAGNATNVQNITNKFARSIDKSLKFDKLITGPQQEDQKLLWAMRDSIRSDLKNPELWREAAPHYERISNTYQDYVNSYKNYKKYFTTKETGDNGFTISKTDPGKITRLFSNYNDNSNILRKEAFNNFIDKVINLGQESENYHGFKQGENSLSDHINTLAKNHDNMSQIAEAMSNTKNIPKSNSLMDVVTPVAIAKELGASNPITAAAIGTYNIYKTIKNPYELGNNLVNSFSKFKSVGDILTKVNNRISQGAKTIFSNNYSRGAVNNSVNNIADTSYNKNSTRVMQLANNADLMMNHMQKTTDALYNSMPRISQNINMTLVRGAEFLASKVPQSNSNLLLSSKYEPTASQKAVFNKYYNAVNNPLGTLSEIKNGTLSNQAIEALQAVHPELYKHMQEQIISSINPKTVNKLSYSTKVSLSKFLQMPLDNALLPQSLSNNQATFNLPSYNMSNIKTTRKPSQSGLKSLNLSNRAETSTTRYNKNDE